MVMDPRLGGISDSANGFPKLGDASLLGLDQNFVNGLRLEPTLLDQNFMDLPFFPPDPAALSNSSESLTVSHEGDCSENCDFSDIVLKYISQMLMEEDIEEKTCMYQEALQAAEKSLYEVLGEKYPSLPDKLPHVHHNTESPDDSFTGNCSTHNSCSSTSSNNVVDTCGTCDLADYKSSPSQNLPLDYYSMSTPESSLSNNYSDGLIESRIRELGVHDLLFESQSALQFRRGVEEASKFLPSSTNLVIDLDNKGSIPKLPKGEARNLVVKLEKDHRDYSPIGSRGRKNPHPDDVDFEEGRSNKQSAVYPDSTVRSEMFDMVLLCNGVKGESHLSALREALQDGSLKNSTQNGQSKGSNGGKARGRKHGSKRETVDLRTLLIHCAQAVAADDRRSADQLLKQIRQHSSTSGDGTQRLAKYFADGLEARLAGTGTQIYKALMNKRTSAADILKAYHLFLAACPFRKLTNFFANQTIMNVAENATRLHIVDFGIMYGFQWPCLIQRLSLRQGGPPKLRITGIDLPQPGFRPAERVEETGARLANYAESFNVPFEFNAIAQKWDTIQIEDLKIDRDEVLVVNSLYRLRNLLDETVVVDSPRNAVLNLIRKMNPEVFIHGIVNGAYSAPFFVTRFREALFHFSSLFDMLETNVSSEIEERMLIESEIFGREALNVIACEGSERVERPENYKQWQVRNMRSGFKQLPLNEEIMKKSRDWVNSYYHKDFVIDEDSQWMLQGWKGRIIYAMSSWRPTYHS